MPLVIDLLSERTRIERNSLQLAINSHEFVIVDRRKILSDEGTMLTQPFASIERHESLLLVTNSLLTSHTPLATSVAAGPSKLECLERKGGDWKVKFIPVVVHVRDYGS
jgi:hypothetical protein